MSSIRPIYVNADGDHQEMSDEDIIVNVGRTSYKHTQTEPNHLWVVTHNLGYRPSVTIIDVLGDELWADVKHIDDKVLEIHMEESYTGVVYCS